MQPFARRSLLLLAILTLVAPALALPAAARRRSPPPSQRPSPLRRRLPSRQRRRHRSLSRHRHRRHRRMSASSRLTRPATSKTESVTYIKGDRERFEFQDMVLLKQRDQKRTIQISKAANTYLVSPDGMPPTPIAPGTPAAPPKPSGVIMIATTIVDTGERKEVFGRQARHVKTMIDKRPMAGACDTSRQRIETDGWYIDTPGTMTIAGEFGPEFGHDAGRLRGQDPGHEQWRPESVRVPDHVYDDDHGRGRQRP